MQSTLETTDYIESEPESVCVGCLINTSHNRLQFHNQLYKITISKLYTLTIKEDKSFFTNQKEKLTTLPEYKHWVAV